MQLSDNLAARVVEEMRRARWKIADPLLHDAFRQKNEAQIRRAVRGGLWTAVLTYLLYGLFDAWLFPDVAGSLIATRFALGIFFLTLTECCIRFECSLSRLQMVAAAALVAGGVGWLLVATQTEHQNALSDFVVFGTVFILGSNLFFNFRFWLSAISSLLITGFYAGIVYFRLDVGLTTRTILSIYFINLCALSLYLSWRLGVERYQTFLHGLHAEMQENEAKEKGRQLVEIANTDPLTGLKNRRAFTREFDLMRRLWLNRSVTNIGVLLIDVDYFKRFNDRLGHQAGDDCLVKLARTIHETAEANGSIAGRYGGEEFVVLCGVEDSEQLSALAERLCEAVEGLGIDHPDRSDGGSVVTISVGASMTRQPMGADLNTLLQEADRALYASKFSGRATYTIFDPETIIEEQARQNLSELLDVAIEKNLVSVVYQPLVDAESHECLGFESLMRLKDLDHSAISPAVFIPLAEKTGAIIPLGLWMIDRVCADMAERKLGAIVSVNVSSVQLRAPGFPLRLAETLGRHGIRPQNLALEITESVRFSCEPQAFNNVMRIRELGIQVWLDDFGTGYSGLELLRMGQFDLIKIDRSFLHDCETREGYTMLRDIISLVRNRRFRVLVEGVETEEQARLLRDMEVDMMQGFHLGRPKPIDEHDIERLFHVA
ncbi:putative bifunctional diguanylate cyclase/phosphodiesterase [Jiella marina]|uniref:putative bifunctional diguanylate cyclase/phosphodiesterase n=1 Tax=Jiella sp. LLJ827 TaxID=2917712 RepID=UPI00210111A9|nr:bifunctional diguanylate cyclase/phosphodiesterase [Jiella sp. LLJ827]MCQ0989445.1 bifunctional diguanylate cyclase/phosphodiesterase [Jiella sp. LLJ827]